jgi:hypothetical protein
MTDRELLERAARAAGMTIGTGLGELHWWPGMDTFAWRNANGTSTWWNPLKDDGDALRLAVKLRMQILRDSLEVTAEAPLDFGGSAKCSFVEHDALDAEAATRRAIVSAAAAMAPEVPA